MSPNSRNADTNVEHTKDVTRLLRLSSTGRYPFLSLIPGFVEREQARLTATLDQLVRLRDELGREDPARELGVGSDGIGFRVPGDLSNLRRREREVGGNFGGGIYVRSAF